jgi:MFS family permease
MVFAVLSALGQAVLVGKLVRIFGEKRVALIAVSGVTLGLVLFAVAMHPAVAWLALCVFGLSNGVFLPAVTSLVSFEADPRSRGAVMGAFNSASSAGRIVGPALSGPIYFNFGHAAPFVASAILTALGAVFLSRAHERPVEPAPGTGQG